MSFPADPRSARPFIPPVADDVETRAAAILGVPAQSGGGDVEARAAAILGVTQPTAAPAPAPAQTVAAPAPAPAPFAVSESGPRVVGMEGVRALADQYGVTPENGGQNAEFVTAALDALRGDTTAAGAAYRSYLEAGRFTPETGAQMRSAVSGSYGPSGGVLGLDALSGGMGRTVGVAPTAADATGTRLGQDPFSRNTTTASPDDAVRAEVIRLRALAETETNPALKALALREADSAETAFAERTAGAGGMVLELGQQAVRGVAEVVPSLMDAGAVLQEITYPGSGELVAAGTLRGADNVRRGLDDVTDVDPVLSRGTAAQVFRGLGSSVPYVGAALATGGTSIAGVSVGAAGLGAAQGGGQGYREGAEARAAGTAGDDAVWANTFLQTLVGVGEGVPLGRAFERANTATGGVLARTLRQIAAEAGEEAAQEWLGAQLNDAAARATVDPSRPYETHFMDAAIGALAGGSVGGVLGAVTTPEAAPAEVQSNPLGQRERVYGRNPVAPPVTQTPAVQPGIEATPATPDALDDIDAELAAIAPLPDVTAPPPAAEAPSVAAVRPEPVPEPLPAPLPVGAVAPAGGVDETALPTPELSLAVTEGRDPVLLSDVRAFVETRADVSASVLQRSLGLRYGSAVAALDALEAEGIVSGYDDATKGVRTVTTASAPAAEAPADVAAPALSPEAATIAEALPFAENEEERAILQAELDRLTRGVPVSPADSTPAQPVPGERGTVAEGERGGNPSLRTAEEQGTAAETVDSAGRSAETVRGRTAVDSSPADGQPVAPVGAPAAADAAAVDEPAFPRSSRAAGPPVTLSEARAFAQTGDTLSAGMLQKEFGLGLTNAKALLDALAAEGTVGLSAGSKTREVFPSAASPVPTAGYGAQNAAVTRDAYTAALATLKAKAGQLASNPLPDADTLSAWATVAGYHIEAGVRRFADFSARMVADAGEAVRPHLDRLFREAGGVDAPEPAPAAAPTAQDVLARIAARRAAQATPDAPTEAPARPAAAPKTDSPAETPAAQEDAPAAPTMALNKSAIGEARALLNLSDLPAPMRQRWDDLLRQAQATGASTEIQATAEAIVKKPRAVTPLEHVALVLRAAELQQQYRGMLAEVERVEADGGDGSAFAEKAQGLLEMLDTVTQASDLSGTEAARALSIRSLRLNAETFEMAEVLRGGRANKGSALTSEERSHLADLVGRAEATDRRVKELEARLEASQNARARKAAERAVATTPEARREAAKEKVKRDRAVILDELKALGLRVNDVTGLTVDGSILVGRLALNIARQGALNLAEVVERVQEMLPDLTPEQIVRAIAEPKTKRAVRTDAELLAARVERARAQKAVRAAQRALTPTTLKDQVVDIVGAPRSLAYGGDMSMVLRQGWFSLFVPPPNTKTLGQAGAVNFGRAFAKGLKAFTSETAAETFDYVMRMDPRFALAEAYGLEIAALGDGSPIVGDASKLAARREEAFMSRLIQRMPLPARVAMGAAIGGVRGTFSPLGPGVGTAAGAALGGLGGASLNASERHAVVFMNAIRFSLFTAYADAFPDAPADVLRAYADLINTGSGRGNLGRFNSAAPTINLAVNAARWTVSRAQYLAKPVTAKGVRGRAAISVGGMAVGTVALMYTLDAVAHALGWDDEVEIGVDPESPDFGKLVFFSERYDFGAGFRDQIRLALRIGRRGTDRMGLTEPLPASRSGSLDLTWQWAGYKMAPGPRVGLTLWEGENAIGEPEPLNETITGAFVPLTATSTLDAIARQGPGTASRIFLANWWGIGGDVMDAETKAAPVMAALRTTDDGTGAYTPRLGQRERGPATNRVRLTDEQLPVFKDAFEAAFARRLQADIDAATWTGTPAEREARAREHARLANLDAWKEATGSYPPAGPRSPINLTFDPDTP